MIAHEYFHNWTGDRVTCRDWFQLTLKEGLTMYRDSRYTADMTAASTKRINDVQGLRKSVHTQCIIPLRCNYSSFLGDHSPIRANTL